MTPSERERSEVEILRDKLSQEQMLSDRLFRGLENVPLFPGWRELRDEYLRLRGWPVAGEIAGALARHPSFSGEEGTEG